MSCSRSTGRNGVLPLRTFLQETLRRSRTSYSTLQVALYYLLLIRPHVPKDNFTKEQTKDSDSHRSLQCGRRMFLSALILASKYLQDRNYSARAWSKISGLHVHEINRNENAFLQAVAWRLHVTDDIFQKWSTIVLHYTPSVLLCSQRRARKQYETQSSDWKFIVLGLNITLGNIDSITSSLRKREEIQCSRLALSENSFTDAALVESSLVLNESRLMALDTSSKPSYASRHAESMPGAHLSAQPLPSASATGTPAAGSFCLIDSSAAMAYTSTLPRQAFVQRPQPPPPRNSPSKDNPLAPSHTTISSPGSMVSDTSSRSSQASFFSSNNFASSVPAHSIDDYPSPQLHQNISSSQVMPISCGLDGMTPLELDVVCTLQDMQKGSAVSPTSCYTAARDTCCKRGFAFTDYDSVLQDNVRGLLQYDAMHSKIDTQSACTVPQPLAFSSGDSNRRKRFRMLDGNRRRT